MPQSILGYCRQRGAPPVGRGRHVYDISPRYDSSQAQGDQSPSAHWGGSIDINTVPTTVSFRRTKRRIWISMTTCRDWRLVWRNLSPWPFFPLSSSSRPLSCRPVFYRSSRADMYRTRYCSIPEGYCRWDYGRSSLSSVEQPRWVLWSALPYSITSFSCSTSQLRYTILDSLDINLFVDRLLYDAGSHHQFLQWLFLPSLRNWWRRDPHVANWCRCAIVVVATTSFQSRNNSV